MYQHDSYVWMSDVKHLKGVSYDEWAAAFGLFVISIILFLETISLFFVSKKKKDKEYEPTELLKSKF